MSFRLFIYYGGLCGGWAALAGWALGRALAPAAGVAGAAVQGLLLGALVALGLGLVDALSGLAGRRLGRVAVRVSVAVAVGGLGGLMGGAVGQASLGLTEAFAVKAGCRVLGWTITGLLIGASVGVVDVLARRLRREDERGARRKMLHGLLGGAVGGLVGGVLSVALGETWTVLFRDKERADLWSPGALGFLVLGLSIGLLSGWTRVVLKEVWLKVEQGFRPGREVILTRSEVTLGRAESCDVGLFGDPTVEKLHARITLRDGAYVLADADTTAGTFLNGLRLREPTPLRAGDAIGLGRSVLRFGERRKK